MLSDGFSLQTDDGSTFVTLKAGEIQITAAMVKIVGDIEHTGNLVRTGDTTTTGAVINNGKDVSSTHQRYAAGRQYRGGFTFLVDKNDLVLGRGYAAD